MGSYNTLNIFATNSVPNVERLAILEAAERLGLELEAGEFGNTLYVTKLVDAGTLGKAKSTVRFSKSGSAIDVSVEVSGDTAIDVLGFNAGINFTLTSETISFTVTGGEQRTFPREDFGPGLIDFFEPNYPDLWRASPEFRSTVLEVISSVKGVQTDLGQAELEVLKLFRAAPDVLEIFSGLGRRADNLNIAECSLAGTPILLHNGTSKAIEQIEADNIVVSYDAAGALISGRVMQTFRNEVSHLLDVHGLKVTPGHATPCGDGMFKGRHVPIIDILLSDGALVQADGTLVRMAINAPAGSVADAFVKVAVALTPEDMQTDTLTEGEMRVGTLLFDREGTPVSVLDCLTAEGYAFDPETGLIAKPGEVQHPLFWFGRLPRPEDYIHPLAGDAGGHPDGWREGRQPVRVDLRTAAQTVKVN
jgi:hypothetical protein